jgi:NADH dehydrogenase [ubiquinone] 1 alpha subcomplex assembly factor 1
MSKDEPLPLENAIKEDTTEKVEREEITENIESEEIMEKAESEYTTLFNFAESSAWAYWNIVNDGVMGGISQSRMVQTLQSTALFSGEVSLENNGGFASVEARFAPVDLSGYDGIEIAYRGDNKRYGFNMRDRLGRTVYQADFVASEGDWQNVRIPFDTLQPLFFGRKVSAKPFNPENIQTMQFIISDKQAGPFTIELKTIKAYRDIR